MEFLLSPTAVPWSAVLVPAGPVLGGPRVGGGPRGSCLPQRGSLRAPGPRPRSEAQLSACRGGTQGRGLRGTLHLTRDGAVWLGRARRASGGSARLQAASSPRAEVSVCDVQNLSASIFLTELAETRCGKQRAVTHRGVSLQAQWLRRSPLYRWLQRRWLVPFIL